MATLFHTVRQGDCLSTIALAYGFRDYKTVYEHPDNEELRKLRPDPNVLFPGDRVVIPDKEPKEASIATTRSHRFEVKARYKVLRLVLLEHGGEAIANAPFKLTVSDQPIEGKTGGDGSLEVEVPIHARAGTLEVGARKVTLHLGGLNPVKNAPDEGVSGAQSRLRNMGYDVGPIDGKLGPRTRMALALFQSEEKLDVTGKLDDATADKLAALHGC